MSAPKSKLQHLDAIDQFTGAGIFNKIDKPEANEAESKHLEKMFDLIFSEDNIDLKTDLTPQLIVAETRMQTYAEEFKVSVVNDIVKRFNRLRLSNGRQSRKEFTDISKSASQLELQQQQPQPLERLFGKK